MIPLQIYDDKDNALLEVSWKLCEDGSILLDVANVSGRVHKVVIRGKVFSATSEGTRLAYSSGGGSADDPGYRHWDADALVVRFI